MICTITYNGKEYSEQEFKKLIEASFNNYKAAQTEQNSIEAYNTVMKQADALLGFLNQYNVQLDEDKKSFEPKEIDEENRKEITKQLMKIAGLDNNHFNYFSNYVSETAAKNLNVNADSITNEGTLKASMKKELESMLDGYESTLDNLAEKLNLINKPDDKVVQLNLKKIQVAKEKIKLVKDNFDMIANVGLQKLYKDANIKVNTITNEDGTTTTKVEEADDTSRIADMEEESAEDSITDFEETNSERDENYSQTSLEKNPKNSVRKELRMLMRGIPLTDKDGNPMNTVMGVPAFVDFDTVFDTVIALMADKSFTFDEAVAHLRENADVRPWMNEFVNRLEKADGQVKNQFLHTMGNHALTMHFVQYSFDKDGNLTAKVMNTNSAELRRKTLSNWRNDFLGTDLVDADVETGQYFANKNEALRLLEEYESWTDNVPEDVKNSGARNLKDLQERVIREGKDLEVTDVKTIRTLGLNPDDFKEGEVKKYSVNNKIGDSYDSKELRVEKINGKLKYTLGNPTTPAIGRALKVKNISKDGKTIPIMEYSNMSIDDQAEAVDTVLTWLDAFGIDMHPNAIHRILSGQYYVDKNTKLTPDKFFASTDKAHQPIGILAKWLKTVVNSDSMIIPTELEGNHPFRDNAIENGLARFQAKYVENVTTSSFRSGKKSIYGYTAYKYVTDRFIDLKTNAGDIREQLGSLAFSKHSAWLQWLDNSALPNAFNISHLDLDALKEKGKKIFKDNGITTLADADHELVKLAMFMDMKQGSTKLTYRVGNVEFPMRIASMLFPTMSDKSTMVTVKAPMLKLNSSEYYTYNEETKTLEANPEVIRLLFNQLVLPEIERIVDSNGNEETKTPKTTNIKNYDKGKQLLMFLPKLNDLKVSYKLNNGTMWEGSLNSLLNTSTFTMDKLNDELKLQIYPEINKYLNELVNNKMKVWKDNELATTDESGELKLKFFDTAYVKDTDKNNELTNDTKLNVIAFDYVINQMIGNANAYMTIIGDPALYYKADSKESYTKQSEDTFINVGKRLAAMIAPGSKLAESKNETYHQIFLADRVSVSQNIGFLTKVLDGKEFDAEEYNRIMSIENTDEKQIQYDKFMEQYPKSAGYFDIESTDAQEYTTWQEHLHVLKQMGKTSDKVLSLTDEDLKEAEELFTQNTPFEKMTDAQKEIFAKVLQPIKPVYTGQIYDKEQGVMRMMYIKSSSFPLIPQMTAGTELDKLRIALQDFQKGGFVRASYQTANKVGALNAPLKMFDSTGKIKNISQKELQEASLVLNRKDFKIQQDVPFKSGKRTEDTTTLGSQLTKVLFGNGMMDESGFMMDGTSYSGKKLQEIYNETFIELYNLKKQKLYSELGIDEKTNQPIDVKETALKLQKLLREEALDRGWSKQDIDGLEIEFVYDNSGAIVDYKFKLPLWMSANSNRIEALFNAVVNNRLVKVKLPGNAYVAGSEEGFKIQKDFTGIDKSQIVWLNNEFNGELQAANYDEKNNLKTAQILVASKFRDNDGKLIDLLELDKDGKNYKYVIKTDDKGFQLNEKMFTKELLDMITFRIPTSGHMSGSKVTIAGFLPAQNGDLIITPKNFTKQMGQDFDVDKLSSYQLWHTQDEDGKFRPIKAGDKVSNIKEKLLQNKLVNIHLAVFGNSKPSVQKKINTILSTDYAEDQAKMIDNVNSSTNEYFTPLSDEYQKQKMALGASGKIGTGAYSLDVTSHSLFEQAKANGKQLELMNNGLPFRMSFGSISTNGKLGEANAKVVSKKDYFIARLNNLNGNDTVLDNLGRLLKSDEQKGINDFEKQTENYPELKQILDDYNKLQRPIAEVLSERQNIAVDNEKLQVMGKVNLNSYTMDVDKVLCMLGFDKGEDGNSISFLFLSQPIIKDYVAEMSKATSNIKGYNPNAEAEVIQKLYEKYFDADTLKILGDAADAYEFDTEYGKKLTTADMYDELIKKSTKDRTNNHLQIIALNRFLMLKDYGLALRNVQGAINTDSKGLGKSIPEIGEKIKTVTALVSNSSIKNADQLIGDYFMTEGLTKKQYDEKIKEGFIPVTNQLMIRPTTSVGAVSLNALVTANNLWEKHFPYNKDSINKAISEVMELVSKSEASEAKKAEKQHMVLKEIKKYFNAVMTQKNLIKSGTATDERYRLMYDDKKAGKVSLAKYLSDAVSNFPQLKNNKLIQRFAYDIDYTGKPSMILYENTAGANFDEDGLNNALLELLGTDLVLPAFNGEIYSAKKLAQDLINYALLEGGVQEATQFAKFVPISYLEKMGFTEALNSINYDTTNLFGFKENGPSDFAIQFARNNPTSLPKLLMEESKANNVLSSNISITNAGYNSGNAPNFIAYRVKGKDYLWIKIGNEYKPLSVAVSKGNQGQKVFAYDINPNQKQRQISKGKVRDVAPPPVSEPVNDGAASELINEERFGLGQDNFITILRNIINSNNLPANITTILKQLISKVDPNTVIRVVDGLESNGTYQNGVIQINRQYAKEATNEQLARTILKETVHSVTDQLILKHTDEDGQLQPKDGVPGAKAAREIIALYKRAKTALSTGKYADKYKSMLEKFERLQQGEEVGFNKEEKRILYGTVNIKEFIEMIMTQPEFQQAMSEIKIGSSNTTLMDKLRNFIKSVLEAIGVEEGTLTDDAIKNIFQLIEESKPTQTQPSTTSEKSFTTKVDQFTYTYNPVTKQVIHNAKAGDKVETNETQINKVLAAYGKANNFETKVFNKQEYVQVDNKVLNVNTGSRVTQKEILDLFAISTQTDLNQEVYGKVKTNLAALINTENQLLNDNPEQVTFPDEIDYSQFNGYPKIVKFLNEASVTDNQLKFFSAHQDYIEALLNETNATDMDELLEAIGEKEVKPEPTASQIEVGMSDSTIADIENEVAEAEDMISESTAGEKIELFPGVYANKGQTKAIEKLNSFVKDRGRQVFVLKGRGGTGKTTIIKKILEGVKGKEIAAATISHKAKGILQLSMGNEVEVKTIASAIGLKPKRNNPSVFEKDPKFKKEKSPFYNADIIIIDECSMLTQEMVSDIINFSKNPNVKVIFMGDNVQLPPIEENASLQNKDSASFTANTKPEYTATLTERMRQGEDSPIVVLSDVIAANVESTTPELRVITDRRNKFDEKKNKGTLFETKDSMVTQLTSDLQSDKENTKIICFTNAEKDSMNNLARQILWGEGNTNEFNKGEILINEDTKEESLVASADIFNGEQYTVLNSTPVNINFYKLNNDFSTSVVSLPGYSLKVQNESGEMITIQVLSPKVKQKYAELQKNNADNAFRIGGKSWDIYWGNEDQHVKSDYGYAITSHKSQGSTYNNVYVMEDNILSVQDASIKTKNQSLYVAVTRPRYKAVIVSNKNASNVSIGEEYTTKGLNIDTRGKSFEPKEISEEDINNLPRLNCE